MLEKIKAILGEDSPSDEVLSVYLDLATQEALHWAYGNDTTKTELPDWLNGACVMAVVTGINGRGAENELSESVDGVTHQFHYSDMVQYIHHTVPGYAKLL